MKRWISLLALLLLGISVIACTPQAAPPSNTPDVPTDTPAVSAEEKQRMDLYVAVLKAAFHEENGGKEFIAVKLDTLADLGSIAQQEVLKQLAELSPNVYDFETIESDRTKFMLDENGRLVQSINGSLLYIELENYSGNKASITGVSWFGNLGAVFPQYEAVYKNGAWELKLIRMGIS